MSAVAIITARGGSKRIPKKNIKDFCGKPIIAYSIEAAIQSELFDEVMVSTDDAEIAEIARKYGADVPFFRSKENSDDFAGTADVILEVLNKYAELGRQFSEFCCIYPTAPFVTANKLKESHLLLSEDNVDMVVPMVRFSFPPQRGMVMDGKYIKSRFPENINKRSQDLEPMYHDCGQFYFGKTKSFFKNPIIWQKNTVPYIVEETEVQDIDNITDWEIAEIKFKKMKGLI